MPTYKTAKKVSKWRHAHERCLTWSFRIPGAKCRRRVSKKKLDRVNKLMDYWGKKNCLNGWDWGHPAAYYFDKKQRCKIFEYLD